MQYRAVNRDDQKGIYEALHKIISSSTIYNEDAISYEKALYTMEYVNELLSYQPNGCVVAEDSGAIAGFLLCRPDNGPFWLSWFGVLPTWRGMGIGKRLIGTSEEFLRNCGVHKYWCDTRENNMASIRILKSMNWRQVGVLRDHWCHQDYILWEKFLLGQKEI